MSWHEWAIDANMYDGEDADDDPENPSCPACGSFEVNLTGDISDPMEFHCNDCGEYFSVAAD